MKSSDKSQFATMICMTAEIYGKSKPEPQLIKMYWLALQSYSLFSVRSALNIHIQNPNIGQFFPKPADIIRNIDGTCESNARLAWTKINKAIGSVGGGNSVIFDDKLIHAVIDDMGGWEKLCLEAEHELVYKQREFEKRYGQYLLTPPLNYPKKLIGSYEVYNRVNGFDIDSPFVIGDVQRAALVFKHGEINLANQVETLADKQLLEIAQGNLSSTKIER